MQDGFMVTRSDAIKRFLESKTHPDLSELYSLNMECQVNVAQDGGERIEDEYKGRKWHGWTDGVTTWKSFRIPYKANSDPEYNDSEIRFDLAQHAEAIGMTGWDWSNKISRWVAFDFDAITGHDGGNKLSNEELKAVQDAAFNIPWVTIRKSTSGKGLHLYVYLNAHTENHTEHAALARSILGTMSAMTGFDFSSRVDVCGGNMWVWHRKMTGTDGLTLIKKGGLLTDIPRNWRDHINVVTGKRSRSLPQQIPESFEDLSSQSQRVPLDEEHKRLIKWLTDMGAVWWWDQDHYMLVTHTEHLKDAHRALGLVGIFETTTRHSSEINCFLFPMRKGAWAVRRYTPGVNEHQSWEQDGAGWTRCYLNREPDLRTAARTFGGVEDTNGGFVFREAEVALDALQALGITISVDPIYYKRGCVIRPSKDGRLILELESQDHDDPMDGWLRKKKLWQRIVNAPISPMQESDLSNCDDMVRHLVNEKGEDAGWVLKSEGNWNVEPINHVRAALNSMGVGNKDLNQVIGSSILKCWRLVNKPFQPEYPGNREWNMFGAQLRYLPSDADELHYYTWSQVLKHCGKGLDDAVLEDGWCKANGILTGADYLKCWVSSLFKCPEKPLPFLFFYGPQNSGKSAFHEALELLVTTGYMRSESALTSASAFNYELEGKIICVVEELDLGKNKVAYNRIKDWVTSSQILIHKKNITPYMSRNTTHWIQCANDIAYCPPFKGDTRITVCYVPPLEPVDLIPKRVLMQRLEKEAPDFLADILSLEIPESNDRLNVPVLTTSDKCVMEQRNETDLEIFLRERTKYVDGAVIKFSEFYEQFIKYIDAERINFWTKIRVGKELPPHYPKGRLSTEAGQFYIGNIAWYDDNVTAKGKFILSGEYLREVSIREQDKTSS